MNNEYLAKMLSDLSPEEALEVFARAHSLRPHKPAEIKEVPLNELKALQEKYAKLASITQKQFTFPGGTLTVNLSFDEEFYPDSLSLSYDDTDNEAFGLIKEALDQVYAGDIVYDLPFLKELNKKAENLFEEINEFVEKYEDSDPELYFKIQNREAPEHRKNPRRRSRRKARRAW